MEQFWRFYSHLVRPGDLSGHSDFHLFKEGIKPMWEVTTCTVVQFFFLLSFFPLLFNLLWFLSCDECTYCELLWT